MRERITTPLNLFLRLFGVLVAMALVGVMATASGAAEGDTTMVSVDSSGTPANDISYSPSISGDGRFVAFSSGASNLVPNDTNNTGDIFVRDRHTGTTERVSVDSAGNQASGYPGAPTLSAGGRYVAFISHARNLVANDTNREPDVFVRDRLTGITQRVSVNSSGRQADRGSYDTSSISSDGRFVAFVSAARNLVANDSNFFYDTFVHERDTTAPRVTRVVPAQGATGVGLKTNVVATFSERMEKTSLTKANFELYKLIENPDGTTTAKQITNVTVRPSPDGLRATLDPYGTSERLLANNSRYKAVLRTGALDIFGNSLDQKPGVSANQPKVWFFKTRN